MVIDIYIFTADMSWELVRDPGLESGGRARGVGLAPLARALVEAEVGSWDDLRGALHEEESRGGDRAEDGPAHAGRKRTAGPERVKPL